MNFSIYRKVTSFIKIFIKITSISIDSQNNESKLFRISKKITMDFQKMVFGLMFRYIEF